MTDKEKDILWDALMTAEALIDDIISIEEAGLTSGFKKGVAKTWRLSNEKALSILNKVGVV